MNPVLATTRPIWGPLARTGVVNPFLDGLWALFKFDDSGDLGYDTMGNLPLTAVNSPTQGAGVGVIPNSAQFNAASLQYMEAPFPATTFDLNIAYYSMACWMKITAIPATGTCVPFMVSAPATPNRVYVVFFYTSGYADGTFLATTNGVSRRTSLVASNWNHYVLVKNNTTPTLYVNGVIGTVINTPIGTISQIASDVFWIARGVTPFMTGNIAQLAIWENRALTQDDATTLYNGGNGTII